MILRKPDSVILYMSKIEQIAAESSEGEMSDYSILDGELVRGRVHLRGFTVSSEEPKLADPHGVA